MVLRTCDLCDRKFAKTEHFKRHQRSHTKERPYECAVCNKRFSRSDVLFRHQKLHSPQPDSPSTGPSPGTPQTLEPPLAPNSHSAFDRRQPPHIGSALHDFNPGPSPLQSTSSINGDLRNISLPSSSSAYDPISDKSSSFSRQTLPPHPNLYNHSSLSSHVDPALQAPSLNPSLPQPGVHNPYLTAPLETPFDFSSFNGNPNDMLTYWLSQADNDIEYPMMTFPDAGIPFANTPQLTPPTEPYTQWHQSSDTGSLTSIPDSRFSRVEEVWRDGFAKTSDFHRIWSDVAISSSENIFCCARPPSDVGNSSGLTEGRWGVNNSIRNRLRAEFETPTGTPAGVKLTSAQPLLSAFPPVEVLDISIDIYFRRLHPIVPFIHIPTFKTSTTSPSLLFTMCILGSSTVSQLSGGKFLKMSFLAVRLRALHELVAMVTTNTTIEEMLCTFATALLTLQLAALSSDKNLMAQSQALYASLMAVAQRHGLFGYGKADVSELLPETQNPVKRWHAWARIESLKRLITCLISADWWWGNASCCAPLVRPETIDLNLPSDDDLFDAPTAEEWSRLLRSGKNADLPAIKPRSFHLKGCLDSISVVPNPLQAFTTYSLLTTVKHMVSDTHHRYYALSDDWTRVDGLVPWNMYQYDFRASSLVPIMVSLGRCVNTGQRYHDMNVAVLWHNISINLCANLQIFELSSGRAGPQRAKNAVAGLAEWIKTSAARRAALHAAETYKLMVNRKVSDHLMLNSMSALFHAALVLGLYVFIMPMEGLQQDGTSSHLPSFDVMTSLDWTLIGNAGLETRSANGSTMDGNSQRTPAVDFINYGGPVSLNGTPAGGYVSARRVLLDFAHVIDEMGAWKPKTYSRILHIMSDVLEES